MANPSISVPDDVLDKFDDIMWELQDRREIPRKASRSEIVAGLMESWNEEQLDEHDWLEGCLEGNGKLAVVAD